MGTIKRQIRYAYGWFVVGQFVDAGLAYIRPIGCTPALSVTWTAPPQLRYAACGAIQELYSFAFAFAFRFEVIVLKW